MKKHVKIIFIIVTIILVFGIVTAIVDYKRLEENKEPIFTLKLVNGGTGKVTYVGMGYKITRYTGVSFKEPFNKHNEDIKFGNWFMIYKREEGSSNEKETLNSKITMIIEENTLTSSGMTLVMKNNSTQVYYYGPQYSLEKYENGEFKTYEPKETLAWNDVLYNIQTSEEIKEVIDWTTGYDKLKSGKYRLVRSFIPNDGMSSSTIIRENYYLEFEIKE